MTAAFEPALKEYAKGGLTSVEFEGDHWMLISHADEVNEKLGNWIEGLESEV